MLDNEYNYLEGKKVAFLTLGCKVNSYETEAMEQLFEQALAQIIGFDEIADIYVVNTCTVTNIADRKSRQMLHKAKKKNNEAVVIAVGCYVQAAKETLLEDTAIDLVIGNNRKKDIVSIVNRYYTDKDAYDILDIAEDGFYEELSIQSVKEKTRAYIKIQDGCNQYCSYCIIPYMRGRIRSRKEEDILEEVKRLIKNGYREIVLTGIHISSFGFDTKTVPEQASLKTLDGSMPLLSLIQKLNCLEGLERIRLGSLEPRIITEDFVKTLATLDKVCPHFHLSLQSGCDETLKRMNRKYTCEEYYQGCELISKHYHTPAITTDVIVGFPQESEEEFQKTSQFLEKVGFAKMHIFQYSIRKGTKAEAMLGQITEACKHKRSGILIKLDNKMRQKYLEQFIHTEELILTEEEIIHEGNTYMIGHNQRYVRIAFQAEKCHSNELIKVKTVGFLKDDILLSEIID
jgi:threonylcarbamoyladenosine tRNA methylthiotransferase MtaB